MLLGMADSTDGFASPIFVLAVLLISRFTDGYLFGLIASVLGVIGVNFIFTYPYWAFNFKITGYPLTSSPAPSPPRLSSKSSFG